MTTQSPVYGRSTFSGEVSDSCACIFSKAHGCARPPRRRKFGIEGLSVSLSLLQLHPLQELMSRMPRTTALHPTIMLQD